MWFRVKSGILTLATRLQKSSYCYRGFPKLGFRAPDQVNVSANADPGLSGSFVQ